MTGRGTTRRTGLRLKGAAVLVAVSFVATLAAAQTRRSRPKPPPAVVDAGTADKDDDSLAPEQQLGGSGPVGAADAGRPPAPGTGPVPPPVGYSAEGDAGVKASPLNPAANEMPGAVPVAGADAGAVDYERLLGDIAALRARVAAVADNLFHSRVAIAVQTDNDHARIGRLAVSLDDGVVYTSTPNFRADAMTVIYDRAVAPGRHAITVDIDRSDDRNDAFRTAQRSRFTVDVVKDERLDVQIKLIDDSDMGADFPGGKRGDYDLRVKVKAVSKAVKR